MHVNFFVAYDYCMNFHKCQFLVSVAKFAHHLKKRRPHCYTCRYSTEILKEM